MEWKSCWLEAHDSVEELKTQRQSEGYGPYQWSGRPGGAYLDYIHSDDEVVCVLSGTADVKVADETDRVNRGDRVDVPASRYHSLTVTCTDPLFVFTGMRRS